MKKKILLFLLLFFPYTAFAELGIFLSSDHLPYTQGLWTGEHTPDSDSSQIHIKNFFHRESVPSDYRQSPGEIQTLIRGLFPTLDSGEQQARYESLMHFTSQNLAEYLAIAISSDTDTIIVDKSTNGILLTPFESVFQTCGIPLSERQDITRALIEEIHIGTYATPREMRYSDIRFGDCIIPFPDARRGQNLIMDSFPSNTLIAQNLSGNPLSFGALEEDIDLISLKNIDISGSFQEVQDDDLLHIQSSRVDSDSAFNKIAGKNKILFVHQNYFVNPFGDSLIQGNDAVGYTIAGNTFHAGHPLAIQTSDTEEKRTLSAWSELTPGVYVKTLLQENSFETIGGVYKPKQSVGASRYYAITYNYDTTPPSCDITLFSHENIGNNTFVLPENPWFHKKKYASFICSDIESGCACDTANEACFFKDETVASTPQVIPHTGGVSYTFKNAAGIAGTCQTEPSQKVFYDTLTPDMKLFVSGVEASSLTREYVHNNGVVYNGKEVIGKKLYHIKEEIEVEASDTLDIELEIYDPYNASLTDQGVSGIQEYTLEISKFQDDAWMLQKSLSENYDPYNPNGSVHSSDTKTIQLQNIENIDEIATKAGIYQITLHITDAAHNISRVIWYLHILPGVIDTAKSTISVDNRNNVYANDSDTYNYTISLKDRYLNPIVAREFSDIDFSCAGISNCKHIPLDITSGGGQALDISWSDNTSNNDGDISFNISGKAPGVFSEGFNIDFLNPAESLVFIGETNSFLAPFEGSLETKQGTQWFDNILTVESEAEYRLRVVNTGGLAIPWSLNDFSSLLKARHPDTSFALSSAFTKNGDALYFTGTFHSSLAPNASHKTLLEIPDTVDNAVSGVLISYMLGGKTVRYRLYKNHMTREIITLGNTGELKNPVQIIGQFQGVGNSHNDTERQNFTDLNSNALRNALRKNIEKNIIGRSHNTNIGGIQYIDKSNSSNKLYILPEKPDFETLIVRNGNIHITQDFNPDQEKVGIISYNDRGYNKEIGYQQTGNIYVENTVNSINAFIYADGALISTQSGNPIEGSIAQRVDTKQGILLNQLKISGALFTRNTLAGGRELSGTYILPGGENTSNRSLALQYDLYYTRRGNNGCHTDSYGFCDVPYYMIIEYDARVQNDPPKLFSTPH